MQGEDREEVQAGLLWSRTTGNRRPGTTRRSAGTHIPREITETSETAHATADGLRCLPQAILHARGRPLDHPLALEKSIGCQPTVRRTGTSALALLGSATEIEKERPGTGTGTAIAKTENGTGIDATEKKMMTGTTTQTIQIDMTVVTTPLGASTIVVVAVMKAITTMTVHSDMMTATGVAVWILIDLRPPAMRLYRLSLILRHKLNHPPLPKLLLPLQPFCHPRIRLHHSQLKALKLLAHLRHQLSLPRQHLHPMNVSSPRMICCQSHMLTSRYQ